MMLHKSNFVLAIGLSVVALTACSDKQEEVKPDPSKQVVAPSTPSASVVEAPPADSPASNTQDPPKPSGQEDDPNWMCPQGTSGAKMVLIPVKAGTPYCIDEREATYGEYGKFVDAKGKDFSGQPPECAWNDDYGPVVDWEVQGAEDLPPRKCGPSLAEAHPDRALKCVDFCDAWMFCAHNGKRLCGLRGAEAGKVNMVDRENDGLGDDPAARLGLSSESEWYNVCTQGGTTAFPYGSKYDPGRCVDAARIAAEGDTARNVSDTAGNECRGTQAPYDRVYNMSGGHAEWLNICRGPACATDGGDWGNDSLSCSGSFGVDHMREFRIGVRCCADAAPKTVKGR